MASELSNLEKVFLRSCINHGTLPIQNAENLLTTLSEKCEIARPPNIPTLIAGINSAISQFNQKLEIFKHPLAEGTGEYLVFAYTYENDVCKLQKHYSEEERHYFMKLIEALVTNEEFGMPWMRIYNVSDTIAMTSTQSKKLTKQRMQELVLTWLRQGYFFEKNEILYLGARMLVEYGTHLKMNYSELIDDCPLCKNLVLWDIKCGECGVKIHTGCIRKYLIRKSTCPSCNKTWNIPLSQ